MVVLGNSSVPLSTLIDRQANYIFVFFSLVIFNSFAFAGTNNDFIHRLLRFNTRIIPGFPC